MSMTEAASESRRTIGAVMAAAPIKVEAARAALIDLGDRARDLVAGAQSRARDAQDRAREVRGLARDRIDARRSVTADRLEDLADALRPAAQSRRRNMAVAGGSGLALVAVLGAGVALGLVLSREMKKRADLRAAEERTLIKETPPMPQAMEQDAVGAGVNF
jgi:hypothetical protein